MTKAQLIKALKERCHTGDVEADHSVADDLLLAYINDKEVKAAYDEIDKWYA
jgi:hypothetical protein